MEWNGEVDYWWWSTGLDYWSATPTILRNLCNGLVHGWSNYHCVFYGHIPCKLKAEAVTKITR